MKKYYLLATALAAMISCTSDDYVGDNNLQEANGQAAISFNMNTPAVTRAQTGATAAGTLHNNFVLFGYKTVSETSSTVFDNYQVNYVASTEGSTESNSAGWEYVSYKNLPFGTRTASDGAYNNNGVASNASGSSTNVEQSIKYWDFAATSYDFFAYSLGAGTGETPTYAQATAMSNSTYTLTGSQAQLGACYISKKKHMAPSTSTTEVDLEFMRFLSKIQLKFYETIPGYSVQDIKFYTASDTKSTGDAANDGLKPAIYTSSTIPTAGAYVITFDESYDPVVTLSGEATSTVTSVGFDAISTSPSNVWLENYAARDYREAEVTNTYLGRAANAATSTKQIDVLPNSTGAVMTLKMDYTLVSRDGTGETIKVTGATATIPTAYTKWKPNYAYTYIFKISDNTNGVTNPSEGPAGLYPVTLDAQVIETTVAEQTTITTVHTPSITTYQKGAVSNEYTAGNIYVVVDDGTALTVGTNANLYTATIEAGAAQGIDGSGNVAITEEMVANALTKTLTDGKYTLTDANGKKLTVTPVATTEGTADRLVGQQTSIPAEDAPNGKEITINCAVFAAATDKVYVFEYIDTSDSNKKHYKVIKVGNPTAIASVTPGP